MILDLSFERIDEASVLSGFYCGILSMDVFIHEKLQEYLNQTDCAAYVIKAGNEIVAMLCLGSDTLTLDDDDKDEMKSGIIPKPDAALKTQQFFAEMEFPAIEITYLAVDQKWRGQGIGEYIISQVEKTQSLLSGRMVQKECTGRRLPAGRPSGGAVLQSSLRRRAESGLPADSPDRSGE